MPTLVSTGQFTIVDVNDSPISNLTPPSELTSVATTPMGGWTTYSGTLSNSSIVNDQVGPNGEYPRIVRISGDGTIVGWYHGYKYSFKVDITKAYVTYCWIRKRTATSANIYLGWTNAANSIDNLAGVNDSNPYFISAQNPTIADKWYLCVGVIWPAGYGGGDTGLAGMYDPHTGVRVHDGNEWRHNTAATTQFLRFGFYNNTTAQATTDGYDFLPVGTYCMDGTHPTKEAIMNTVPAAMTAALSKETYVFPADNAGAVSTYAGSGTQIRVYQGAAELTYDGVGTAKGTWRVASTTPTNITVGAITDSGTFATVADHSGVAAGTDTSTIVYNIAGTTLTGAAFTLVKTQTFAKAKAGTNGTNGTRTAVLEMYQWASSAPSTFPSGSSTYTWSTGTFTAPATPNSWTLTPGTPSAGQTLYVVRQVYTDSLTAATSSVTWAATSSAPSGASGTNGNNGTNGQRVGVLEVYQWATSSPTSYPSGTSTYTWATGAFTAPTTPNGWSLTPGAAVAGQTLWGISVSVSDNLTTATSSATWNSSTPYAVGYAGTNGSNGERGSKEFFASGAAWSDTTANTAITNAGLTKVLLDQVTISNGTSFAETRFWNGTAWATISQVINGNLLVNGTVGANALVAGTVLANVFNVGSTNFKLDGAAQGSGKGALIVSNGSQNILTAGYIDGTNIGLSIKDAAGNIVMQSSAPSGGTTADNTFAPAISNGAITVNVNGQIQGIGTGTGTTVANNQIAVNGSGQLTGIGTGVNTTVANSQITVSQSTGSINGIGTGNGVSVANNQDNIIRAPQGGVYTTSTSTLTGAIKIALPQSWTNTMMRFTVEIYEYTAGLMCTIEIGGYNYTPSTSWINVSARVLGSSNVEYPVYFGHDGTKCCVWIGSNTENWSYPQVRIRDFFAGFSNTSRTLWESGWAISFDTTALTSGVGTNQYSASVLDTLPGADWSKTARRPTNLTNLIGTENIRNTDISISSGQLNGIGTGSGTAVANNAITISSGQLNGIGTGSGTTVANNAITVDLNGVLQGTGTSNVVVNNGIIAVNGSGQITGIGTGNTTTVANNQISVSGGAINGIGTGSGTAIDNNYTLIGQNLLPNSDCAVINTWILGGYNPNGANITVSPRLAEGYGGWDTSNYVLAGSEANNSFTYQEGIATGTADGSGDNAVACDIYMSLNGQDVTIPAIASEQFIGSCYFGNHRCKAEIWLAFFNSSGTALSYHSGNRVGPTNTLTNTLSAYQRSYIKATAPANTAYVKMFIRKFNTLAGNSNSYLWWASPQLERVNSGVTLPSPYQPGPPSSTRQLGYTGDLNATLGATIGTNLGGTFTETEFNNRFNTNIINGTYLKDATITNAKIADLAVTSAKIANATIQNAKIADLAITSAKIVDGAITNAKIGDLEVTNAKITNLTIGTQKVQDLAISRSSSSFYNFGGFSYPTNYTWYDVVTTVSNYVYVGVNLGSYDYEYVFTWPEGGYQYVYKGPGQGDYNYVSTSAGLITSVVTGSSTESGSQVVNIEAVVAIERDGGSDDNVGARVIRTNDSTILPESYSTLRARSGKSTYALMFRDPSPIAGTTNTYKVQMYNNNDDSHIYEAGMRATLFRK